MFQVAVDPLPAVEHLAGYRGSYPVAHESTAAADASKNGVTQASPFQSLGERPEMELDLWEGQFNLSSPTMEQFSTSLSTEDLQQLGLVEGDSSTCWGEDSAVTMGTVRK